MDRFIDKIKEEAHGEILGDLEIVRIPLDLYRARNATGRQWLSAVPTRPPIRHRAGLPRRRLGNRLSVLSVDLARLRMCDVPGGLIAQPDLPLRDMLDRYELYSYKQWLRVYMRSKMIKHNKDLLERIDDPFALLDKLHIY